MNNFEIPLILNKTLWRTLMVSGTDHPSAHIYQYAINSQEFANFELTGLVSQPRAICNDIRFYIDTDDNLCFYKKEKEILQSFNRFDILDL